VDSSKIDLIPALPGTGLCSGATLTVTFDATSAGAEGPHSWVTELFADATQFDINGEQPQTVVDGTPPPVPTIDPHANVVGTPTTSFTFSSLGATSFECHVDAAAFSPCSSGSPVGPFGDGLHTFYVRALDDVGNASEPASSDWTIDTTAPPVPTIDPHANVVGTPTTSFTFSSLGATSFECHVDAAAFSPCSSGSPVGPFGDGLHTFYVRALDDVGNASEPASSEWTIDTVNPVVTLTDKPPLITNQSTGSFSFSSNKPNSTLECKLDGAEFSGCTSPQLYFGLDDGAHTFSVQATSLGNTGPATEYTWTVDTVAPDTTITSTPPAASNSASASFTFASSEVGSTFSCGLDAGGFAPCASPKNYAGLGDGAHTFRVQAVDAAGNVDTSPASYSWQIAGVGPATTDTTPPGNVKRLKRSVAYRVLKLAWTRPSDSDFDHVKVFVSTSAKSPPRTLVYRGKGRAYTNKRFKNGLYYRYAVVSYDRIGNASRGAAVVVLPSVLLRSPRNGAVVKSPPRLLWAPVPKATFYNVQLYSTTAKMLSAWPGKAKLTLSRRWSYNGRRFELRKGLYRWFVWPGFGPRAKGRYGQLLGQGTFRVS
jgi:hypothetical protein